MTHVNPFELGEWTVDPARNELLSAAARRTIEPKAMELLLRLASTPGVVISKEELLRDVWKGAHVVEHVVPKTMSSLRKALGDRPRSARYIETVSQNGYLLLLAPRPVASGTMARTPPADDAHEVRSSDSSPGESARSDPASVSIANPRSSITERAHALIRLVGARRGLAAAATLIVVILSTTRIHTEPRSRLAVGPTRGQDPALARDAEDALVHDLARSSCLAVTKEADGADYHLESNLVDAGGNSILRTRLVRRGIYVAAGDANARAGVVAASPVATKRVLQHICRDHKCSCPPRFFRRPPGSGLVSDP